LNTTSGRRGEAGTPQAEEQQVDRNDELPAGESIERGLQSQETE